LVGTSVQVPFRAVWSCAKAANAKRSVVKTAPVIVTAECFLMISLRGLTLSTESHVALGMLEHARCRSGKNSDAGGN
jgi:hypothetical protein